MVLEKSHVETFNKNDMNAFAFHNFKCENKENKLRIYNV